MGSKKEGGSAAEEEEKQTMWLSPVARAYGSAIVAVLFMGKPCNNRVESVHKFSIDGKSSRRTASRRIEK